MASKMALARITFLAAIFLAISNIASAYSLHGRRSEHRRSFNTIASPDRRRPSFDFSSLVEDVPQNKAADGACTNSAARAVKAPKKNIWWGLTKEEHDDVQKFLLQQDGLNPKGGSPFKVYDIELMAPNKTDAIPYLDQDKQEPARYARVLLHYRSHGKGHFQNLLVGPLPVRHGTTKWSYLSFPFTKKSNGRIRDLEVKDANLYKHWINKMGKAVEDITLDLWNGTAAGYKNDTLLVGGIDPYWQDDGIVTWQSFFSLPDTDFDIFTLTPLGLYFQLNITADDWKDWKVMGWLYDDQFFSTTKAFRKAYFSKKLPRLPAGDKKGNWAITDRHGPKLPLDHLFPPTLIAPSGTRFYVDREENYVKWMDFEFYHTFDIDTALRLFDIKYKGKRIIYELGMQEALAHYAGNDPIQSSTAYLDSYFSFGYDPYPLVPGYDCPSYATYFQADYYGQNSTSKGSGPICLFEMDAGYPISRHNAYDYIAATKNIYLTLRSVSTIGNYDYQFDYSFYMDGSIRVDVRASGYIQSAYFAKNEDYGYKIHKALSGSMHDHVLNYKVDFDIEGVKNTMQLVKNVPHSQVYPWSNGKSRNTMKLQRNFIKSEDESKLNWGLNGDTQFIITNQDKKNEWGESPGFRINPASGAVHLTAEHSSNLGKAAGWTSHDLFVTKQKDTEPRSANPTNNQDLNDPLVNFDDFFDGESLEQTDLVTWFNLGMHHIPHSGDLPITVFTTAHSGVVLQPINYLSGSPTVQTVNMIRLNVTRNATEVTLFGQDKGMCTLDYSSQTLFGRYSP